MNQACLYGVLKRNCNAAPLYKIMEILDFKIFRQQELCSLEDTFFSYQT